MIVCLEVNVLVILISSLYLIIDFMIEESAYLDRLDTAYKTDIVIPFIMILGSLCLTSMATLIANTNLIGLHIYLKLKGLSTYQYILN
jgi:hypothetical protein